MPTMYSRVDAMELLRQSARMFSKKDMLHDLWQTVSEEICPDRATFTADRVDGEEFADHLVTSLPCQNHRDLAYAMGSLTRPKNQVWFDVRAKDKERNTDAAKAWLRVARDRQRDLLYSHKAGFQSAMAISDRDVVAFGNAVVSHSESPMKDGTQVYQTHHLKDCAWSENYLRIIDRVDRKFKMCLRNWSARFPDVEMPNDYKAIMKEDPYHEVELLHIVMPSDMYGPFAERRRPNKMPFVSIYLDPAHQLVLRAKGFMEFPYTVRRWQLQEGSPYARSPAADLGLVEARLLQNQERIINDAGELAVDPPWTATRGAVLGDVGNYPGGMTWVEYEYDERGGAAAKPIEYKGNLPIGLDMKKDTRYILAAAMFINKLTLPVGGPEMTVPEVNERISEYIRSIGPAVEPFEEHNALLLDNSFSFNMRIGQFGELAAVPKELHGADVVFEFDGPIQIAYKRQKLNKIVETVQVLKPIAEIKPEVLDNFDLDGMARRAAEHIGSEPENIVPYEKVDQVREGRAQQIAEAQKKAEFAQMAKLGIDGAKALPALAQGDLGMQQSAANMGVGLPAPGGPQQEELLPLPDGNESSAQSLDQLAGSWSGAGSMQPESTIDAEFQRVESNPPAGMFEAALPAQPARQPARAARPMPVPPSKAVARQPAFAWPQQPESSNTDQTLAELVKLLSAKIEVSKGKDGTYTVERKVA